MTEQEAQLLKERDANRYQGNWLHEMSPGQRAIFYILIAAIIAYFIFHKGEIDWKYPAIGAILIGIMIFKNYDTPDRIYTARELIPIATEHIELLKNIKRISQNLTPTLQLWIPDRTTTDGETKITGYDYCYEIPTTIKEYLIIRINNRTAFVEKYFFQQEPYTGKESPDNKFIIGPEVFQLLRGAKKVNQEFGQQQGGPEQGQGGMR